MYKNQTNRHHVLPQTFHPSVSFVTFQQCWFKCWVKYVGPVMLWLKHLFLRVFILKTINSTLTVHLNNCTYGVQKGTIWLNVTCNFTIIK